MTVLELQKVLELAIDDGYSDATVYFDTEARSFNYHLARVGAAYFHSGTGLTLHEETRDSCDDSAKEKP